MGATEIQLDEHSYEIQSGPITTYCFGKPKDWRIGPGALSGRRHEIFRTIIRYARAHGIKRVYAPRVDMTSLISDPQDLSQEIFRGGQLSIFRNNEGECSDGVVIRPREGFLVASGDCPAIIASSITHRVAVSAHVGFNCLFDSNALRGREERYYPSIIDSTVACLGNYGVDPTEIEVQIILSVSADRFTCPWDNTPLGMENRELTIKIKNELGDHCVPGKPQDGHINLPEVIKQQFRDKGVYTFTRLQPNECTAASSRWHSYEAGDETRNGVLVLFNP